MPTISRVACVPYAALPLRRGLFEQPRCDRVTCGPDLAWLCRVRGLRDSHAGTAKITAPTTDAPARPMEVHVAAGFELYQARSWQGRFRLSAGNVEIIAVGEAYESKSAALNGWPTRMIRTGGSARYDRWHDCGP